MTALQGEVLDNLATRVEKLTPIRNMLVALIMGAFAVGVWVTTLQLKDIEQDKRLDVYDRRINAVEHSSVRTDRNVIKLGQAQGVTMETPRD